MEEVKYPGLVSEMARRGETYSDLGKILILSDSSISRRMSGEIEWSISEIGLICDHYQKNYYELFTKEEA